MRAPQSWQASLDLLDSRFDLLPRTITTRSLPGSQWKHFGAAYIPSTPANIHNQTRICQLALRHRIPAASVDAAWARCGLLLAYSQDFSWSLARAVEYIDKILRGAKASDLPVEQATELLLTITSKRRRSLASRFRPHRSPAPTR